MLRGELYDAQDPQLVAERERARELTSQFNRSDRNDRNRSDPNDGEERRELLQELFGTLGTDSYVEPPFRCDYGSNVHVGEAFYANFDCVILDVCRVEVGRNCMLGPGVHVYTATHPLDAAERTAGLEYGEPVTIGDDVWVGGRAVINPGVTIGDRAVVGSGAVVTEDVPDDVVVQGNPATVVKELDPGG